MRKRLASVALLVSINCAVLLVCLGLIEAAFRFTDKSDAASGASIQWLKFAPYMMFTNPHSEGAFRWDDIIHHRTIDAKIDNNQFGFAMRQNVDFAKVRPKTQNERVVILSGGSAAWGVGATSNDTNIAGRMQTILNQRQNKYHYTVLNLAMGGWVSVQQLIALGLFGRNLQPDWLVVMDATNDVAVTCAHSQGAGYVMRYALMDAYMKAYVFGQLHPVFYRGWIENELIKHSVAYRRLTRQSPVDFDIHMRPDNSGIGLDLVRPTPWADVERQLDLYIQTESEMVDLFPQAKVILSTQPLPFSFQSMFGRVYQARGTADEPAELAALKDQLERIRTEASGQDCGYGLWPKARDWFMPMSALRLEALAKQYQKQGRDVDYVNDGAVFPNLAVDRNAYFIDPVHMNDAGMNVVGQLYSDMILAADLPDRFPKRQWTGAHSAEAASDGRKIPSDEIQIVESTYGLSCKAFEVQPPAMNNVVIGNATDAVATDCMHKRGQCTFAVSVPRIPDPAQGCGKDFTVKWTCGAARDVHEAHLPGEANGKSVLLSCPGHG